MSVTEWLLRYSPVGLTLSKDAYRAALFLESRGKRFLIDFGYANAERLAADELRICEPETRA